MGSDVDGVGLMESLFEIADGQAEAFADLGDFSPAEDKEEDGQDNDHLEKAKVQHGILPRARRADKRKRFADSILIIAHFPGRGRGGIEML